MRKSKAISAMILSCSLLLLLSGCSGESNDIDFGDHTELTQSEDSFEDISEINQGTEAPEEIIYGDPVIGGNAILAQATLDDLTASLIIRSIGHLPDDRSGGDYYCGKQIIVQLKDNKSGAVVENLLPKASYTYGRLYSKIEDIKVMAIDAECVKNSLKFFCIENNGKKEYILKVEYIGHEINKYMSAFACCDMSRYGEKSAHLKWYTDDDSDNEFLVTRNFAYKNENVFSDSSVETEYEFDTENLKVTKRAMDPAEIVFEDPEIGKHSILSQDTLGEYSAVVEIHNIVSLPEDDRFAELYGKTYWGESIQIKLIVNNSVIASGRVLNGLVGLYDCGIPEKCTGEGATRIFRVDCNGETHYVLMQYSMYLKENDSIYADFALLDKEFYEQYGDNNDKAVQLYWYSVDQTRISNDNFNLGLPVSDSFEYAGDGVFRDSFYGYELTFDFEFMSAEARPIQ